MLFRSWFKTKYFPILVLLLFLSTRQAAQSFYDINTIQKIEIIFNQNNWDYMLDTATVGADTYIMAKSVTINGEVFDSVGVKYKGNSTYNANQVKNPFHIELDAFKSQDYQGYTDIKLSNVAKDPSFVREVLSYAILRNYMDAPLSNYANVFVNGKLIGLYVSSESISKKFAKNHFYSNKNPFFKCNPVGGAGPGSSAKPNLVYLGADSSKYFSAYEKKSNYGWRELVALCDTLKNNPGAIEKILDVDRALWMLAFDNLFVNLDSYIGGFAQNYYLYQDNYRRFNPVVWDLNESFGTFSQTGTINLQNTTAKQQMTHLLHQNDAAWPLVQKLLAVPRYKRMYIAHMKTMLSENFANGSYYTTAQSYQSVINSAVNADPNKFFTYTQYQNNLTNDITGGMSGAPGIKLLMDGRNTWLSAQAEFTAAAPAISNILVSDSAPKLNSTVTVTAKVTGATDVFLGYRFSVESPFVKIKMYDDGAHGDGVASDNIFGANIPMNDIYMQYYLYADNSNAGVFSPVRAEHEFYSLFAKLVNIKKGELVINEIMADNGNTVTDPSGQYDDWIELYNNTSGTLNLSNLYLSDSYKTPLKWKFPDNTTLSPKGYLIVWADDDTNQQGLHASFKISATGEKVILSYPDGYVVDSISFGQQIKDKSYLRCPNGTGNFIIFNPSFGTENCLSTLVSEIKLSSFIVYPNPGPGIYIIDNPSETIYNIKIYNAIGCLISDEEIVPSDKITIDISKQKRGIYYFQINNTLPKKVILE